MGTNTETGFTIIETLLFLAVTGLLAVGILVGSGVAIGQQRYRDSVNSLKSYVQEQYSEVTNVVNTRDKSWSCNANATVDETNPSSGEARGTSDCVLLGRFVTVDTSGTKLTATNVVGSRDGGAKATSDIAELANYRLSISPVDQDTKDVSWGARIVQPKTDTPQALSMLIVRSPLSGAVMTFTAEGIQTTPAALINEENITKQRDLCMRSDAGTFVGKQMEVRIAAYATNQGAITIPPESESVCQ